MRFLGRRLRAALVYIYIIGAMLLYPASALAKPLIIDLPSLYFLTATMSTASYSGELQELLRERLKRAGWTIASFATRSDKTYGRTFLYSKEMEDGKRISLLAFPGTERREDVKVDLRLARVPFGGSPPSEFSKREGASEEDGLPLVHKGFNDYVRTALFTEPLSEGGYEGLTLGEAIAGQLKKHTEDHLYLTGHSLGGAAAILSAARLADMGVSPEQLTVVTFGTPAVGNKVFAETYEGKFQLERVEMQGDIMKALLQSPLGYYRFGSKVEWQENKGNQRFQHDMVLYLDSAIRQYYDSESERDMLELLMDEGKQRERIYLAPIKLELDEHISGDAHYIERVLQDYLGIDYEIIPLADGEETKLPIPTLHISIVAKRIRNERYNFRLTLERSLSASDGTIIKAAVHSATANNLTPMETALYLLAHED